MLDIEPQSPKTFFGEDVVGFYDKFLTIPKSERIEVKAKWEALYVY